jgi:hypothetical protein
MSVKVMSAVWEREDMDASERLVMLSLADHADDEGVCYPSIARLCKRTSLTNRTVQMAVKRLEARGLIYVEPNAGRNGTNMFYLFASGPVRQVSKERTGSAATKRRKDAYNPHSVFARDGYRCVYCGFQDERNGSDAGLALHVDHALPLSRGGTDEPSNLVTSCVNCNLRKGDKTAEEFMGRSKCTPQQMHPAFDDARPPHLTAITRAGDAPEPSGTIKETSKENVPSFAEFWDRWPEKKARVSAEKAWARLPAEDRRVVIARCADWFRAWRRGNPQASPIHAATFLNQRRWQDMDETSSTQNPNAVAEFWAKHLNDPAARVPQTAISPSLARLMLELRLVTPETLKRRGFAA